VLSIALSSWTPAWRTLSGTPGHGQGGRTAAIEAAVALLSSHRQHCCCGSELNGVPDCQVMMGLISSLQRFAHNKVLRPQLRTAVNKVAGPGEGIFALPGPRLQRRLADCSCACFACNVGETRHVECLLPGKAGLRWRPWDKCAGGNCSE